METAHAGSFHFVLEKECRWLLLNPDIHPLRRVRGKRSLGNPLCIRIYVPDAEQLSRLTKVESVRTAAIMTMGSARRVHSRNPVQMNLFEAVWPFPNSAHGS